MAVVSGPEADALSVAKAVMGGASFDAVQRLLLSPRKAPKRMGPTASGLLKDMLGKGAVLAMAKGGGYRRDGGQRFWERQAPPRLNFGLSTVRLLQWLLEVPLGEGDAEGLVLPESQGLGDELFLFQVLKLTQGTAAWPRVAQVEAARRSGLCVLGFGFSLGVVKPLEVKAAYSFSEGTLTLVDSWQKWLEKLWMAAEREKAKVSSPSQLRNGGLAQGFVLESFLSAVDQAERRELATFLVHAARGWLGEGSFTAANAVAALNPTAPLRERQEARRAAAAPYRALARLFAWDKEHRNLRFIDDGYAKAQALVKQYERLGERGFATAARVLEELENSV